MTKKLIVMIILFTFLTGCGTDSISPVIENVPNNLEINVGEAYDLLYGVTATDNDLDITEDIEVNIEDTSTLTVGSHTVIYTVTDEAGNKTTSNVTIEVFEIITYALSVNDKCSFITDVNSDIPSLTSCILLNNNDVEIEENLSIDLSNVINSIEGTYSVEIDYIDNNGIFAETLIVDLTLVDFTDLDSFRYELNETSDSYKIILYTDFLIKDIIIPSHINYLPVTVLGPHSFSLNSLKSVSIPDTVNQIGEFAFSGNNLTSIIIPENVTIIENYVFQYNDIGNIDLPNNITSIGNGAFKGNILTEIVFPNTLIYIGHEAFFMDNRIKEIIIPEGVTFIGENAFAANFSNIVSLPDSLITVGRGAFSGHLSDEIYIGDNLSSCENAFGSGQEFNFTENIGQRPFIYTVSFNNINFTGVDGVLFSKDMKTLIDYPLNPRGSIYEIPLGVEVIGAGAFGLQILDEIIIPSTVTTIGEGAFTNVKLNSLLLPSTIIEIERVAFLFSEINTIYFELEILPYEWDGEALENIKVHDFIVNDDNLIYYDIDGVLFSNQTLIKYPTLRSDSEYIIPDGTVFIGYRSFSEAVIEILTIPASVENMAMKIFFIGEVHLTEITVLGDDPTRLNNIWDEAGFPAHLKP